MATTVSESTAPPSSSSSSSSWTDPYKEFELYLEKANVSFYFFSFSCMSFTFFLFVDISSYYQHLKKKIRREFFFFCFPVPN